MKKSFGETDLEIRQNSLFALSMDSQIALMDPREESKNI
jgi:hypothetical protein